MDSRYTVTVDVPIWLIMQRERSLRPYGADVWGVVKAFLTEEDASSYYAAISPALQDFYQIVRGTAQETYDVSLPALLH